MPYGLIQGQGHVALKLRNSSIFKIYLLRCFPWELAIDCWFLNLRTISKFVQAGFLVSLLVFVSRDFELIRKLRCDLWRAFSSDLNEIWYLGRGRWVMHDGMPHGPIQGQGHVVLKVRNSSIFKSISSAISNGSWQTTADSLTRGQCLHFVIPVFWCLS